MLNILVISPMLPATGNTSTVKRLQEHFAKNNIKASFLCSHNLSQETLPCYVAKLNAIINHRKIDFVLLIHAVKSGFCVTCSCTHQCHLSVPYGVIFGGTDINEDVKDSTKLSLMQHVLSSASFYITFNGTTNAIARKYFSSTKGFVQSQALDYFLYDSCKVNNFAKCRTCLTQLENQVIIVLPCSIRPVKDPLFVVDEFSQLSRHLPDIIDIRLLIIGPVTDSNYGMKFYDKICTVTCQSKTFDKNKFVSSPFPLPTIKNGVSGCDAVTSWINDPNGSKIQYLPALSQEKYLSFLKDGIFTALLNTSLSEGMASSVLEAMALGVPVLARDIPGNAAVVKDFANGILFSSSNDFVSKAAVLLNSSKSLLSEITSNARYDVLKNHDPYAEAEFYVSLIHQHLNVKNSSA